jgi:transcription-repair coupling factor (superfamily II helicase)
VLRLEATRLGLRKLDLGAMGGRVHFQSQPNVDPMSVIRLIQSQPKVCAMDGPDKLKIRMDLPDAASRLRTARGLMQVLKTG